MLIYGEDVAGEQGRRVHRHQGARGEIRDADRVFNSPLAEASIVGTAFGLAVRGDYKPVVEIQFGDYIWPAFMQLRDEVAMLRYRSYNHGPARWWSASRWAGTSTAGSTTASRSTGSSRTSRASGWCSRRTRPTRKGCSRPPAASDDPVLFLEHKGLYRQGFASSPEPGRRLPASVRCRGGPQDRGRRHGHHLGDAGPALARGRAQAGRAARRQRRGDRSPDAEPARPRDDPGVGAERPARS